MNNINKKKFSISFSILSIILISIFSGVNAYENYTYNTTSIGSKRVLTTIIINQTNIESLKDSGSGTENDPYIIENVYFSSNYISIREVNNLILRDSELRYMSLIGNLQNLTFDSLSLYSIVVSASSYQLQMKNINILNCKIYISISLTGDSLYDNLSHFSIINNTIGDSTYIYSVNRFWSFRNSKIINNTIKMTANAIEIKHGVNNTIENNKIFTNGIGLYLLYSYNNTVKTNKIYSTSYSFYYDTPFDVLYETYTYFYHNILISTSTEQIKRIYIYDENKGLNLILDNDYEGLILGNYYSDYQKFSNNFELSSNGITYKEPYNINTYESDINPIAFYNIFLDSDLFLNEVEDVTYYFRDSTERNLVWFPSTKDFIGKTNYNITLNDNLLSGHDNIRFFSSVPISVNINGLPIGEYEYNITIDNGIETKTDKVTVKVISIESYNTPPDIIKSNDLHIYETDQNAYMIWQIIDSVHKENETKYEINVLVDDIIQEEYTLYGNWNPYDENVLINLNVKDLNLEDTGIYRIQINVSDGFSYSESSSYLYIHPESAKYPNRFAKTPNTYNIYSNDVNVYGLSWIIFDPNLSNTLTSNYTLNIIYPNGTIFTKTEDLIRSTEFQLTFNIDYILDNEYYRDVGSYSFEMIYDNGLSPEVPIISHITNFIVNEPIINTIPTLSIKPENQNIIYNTEKDVTRLLQFNILDISTSNPVYKIYFKSDSGVYINWIGILNQYLEVEDEYLSYGNYSWVSGTPIFFDIEMFKNVLNGMAGLSFYYNKNYEFYLQIHDGFMEEGLIIQYFNITYKENSGLIPLLLPQFTYANNNTLIKFDTEITQLTYRFLNKSTGAIRNPSNWFDIDVLIKEKIPFYYLYRNNEIIDVGFFYPLSVKTFNIPFMQLYIEYNYTYYAYDGLGSEFNQSFTIINRENIKPEIERVIPLENYIIYDQSYSYIEICDVYDDTIKKGTYNIYVNNELIGTNYEWENGKNINIFLENVNPGFYQYEIIFNDGGGLSESIYFNIEVRSSTPHSFINPLLNFQWYYILIIGAGVAFGLYVSGKIISRNRLKLSEYIEKNKNVWYRELNR